MGRVAENRSSVPADALRVLILTAAPDDRPGTTVLREIVEACGGRRDLDMQVWFLRAYRHQRPWPDTKVVDRLRTWPPAWAASAIGLERIAGGLRGWRLRRWLAEVDPDVIVLDDGLGGRVVEHVPSSVPRVERMVGDRPEVAFAEEAIQHPDAVIVARGAPTVRLDPDEVLREDRPPVRDYARPRDPARWASSRRALRVPEDAIVVAGWGRDGWLDGADLFVRILWHLEHRHGHVAHGVWFGVEDAGERELVRKEARACGLEDRIRLEPFGRRSELVAADALCFPYRVRGEEIELDLLELSLSGAEVVTFHELDQTSDRVAVVETLDLEAAAAALARVVGVTRLERRDAFWAEFGRGSWPDELHRLVGARPTDDGFQPRS